jgi:hypothetical protein
MAGDRTEAGLGDTIALRQLLALTGLIVMEVRDD